LSGVTSMNKATVVTGATSFIGVALLDALLRDGFHVYCIVRPCSIHLHKLPKDDKITLITLELSEIKLLPEMISEPCTFFFHLAWDGVRGERRNDIDLQRNNYLATLQAIEVAQAIGCKKFFGMGSQAEYGDLSGVIDENYLPNPNSAYGKMKLFAYNEGAQLAQEKGIQFYWLRIFSLYGAGDFEGSFLNLCMKKMLHSETLHVNHGHDSWDFLYITDAVSAMMELALYDCPSGVYHLASSEGRKLGEYMEMMKKTLGSQSEIVTEVQDASSLKQFIFKNDKLKQSTNWSQKVSFSEGVLKIAEERKI